MNSEHDFYPMRIMTGAIYGEQGIYCRPLADYLVAKTISLSRRTVRNVIAHLCSLMSASKFRRESGHQISSAGGHFEAFEWRAGRLIFAVLGDTGGCGRHRTHYYFTPPQRNMTACTCLSFSPRQA